MAMKASMTASLPVTGIYKYMEQEFPFFKISPPKGWKNSVRHSLSFSQYFRKVAKQHGYQGQKGFDWEVVPEKQAALDKEVEKFLQAEGRSLIENPTTSCAPLMPVNYEFGCSQILTLPNIIRGRPLNLCTSTSPQGCISASNGHPNQYLSNSALQSCTPTDLDALAICSQVGGLSNSMLSVKSLPDDLHDTKLDADFLQSVDIRDYSEGELCTESLDGILMGPPQQSDKYSEVDLEFSEILDVLAVVERKGKQKLGDKNLDNEHGDNPILQKYFYQSQQNDNTCFTQDLQKKSLKEDTAEELPSSSYRLGKPPSDIILFPSTSFNQSETHHCRDEQGPLSPVFSMIDEQAFVQLVRDARTMEFKFLLKQSEELFERTSP